MTTIVVTPPGTIQNAVNSASSGDTILITPGTYNETVTLTKALILKGQYSQLSTIITQGIEIQASNQAYTKLANIKFTYNSAGAPPYNGGNMIRASGAIPNNVGVLNMVNCYLDGENKLDNGNVVVDVTVPDAFADGLSAIVLNGLVTGITMSSCTIARFTNTIVFEDCSLNVLSDNNANNCIYSKFYKCDWIDNWGTTLSIRGSTGDSGSKGTVQNLSGTSFTLASNASSLDNFYKYLLVSVLSAGPVTITGTVTGYNGTTKVLTVDAWSAAGVSNGEPYTLSIKDIDSADYGLGWPYSVRNTNVEIVNNKFDGTNVTIEKNMGLADMEVNTVLQTYCQGNTHKNRVANGGFTTATLVSPASPNGYPQGGFYSTTQNWNYVSNWSMYHVNCNFNNVEKGINIRPGVRSVPIGTPTNGNIGLTAARVAVPSGTIENCIFEDIGQKVTPGVIPPGGVIDPNNITLTDPNPLVGGFLASSNDNFYNTGIFTSGGNVGEITNYVGATRVATINWTAGGAPAAGDSYSITFATKRGGSGICFDDVYGYTNDIVPANPWYIGVYFVNLGPGVDIPYTPTVGRGIGSNAYQHYGTRNIVRTPCRGNNFGGGQLSSDPYKFQSPQDPVLSSLWTLGAYPDYKNISGISGLEKAGWDGKSSLYGEKNTLESIVDTVA